MNTGVATLIPRLERHSGRGTSEDGNAILDGVLSKLSERHGADVFSEEIVTMATERIGAHLSVSEAVALYVENILLGRNVSEIRIENERLKRAIDLFGINEASMVIDIHGTILDVNEKFLEVSGYSRDEVIGKPTRSMNSGFHPKEFWNDFWKTLQSKKVWIGDICNK
ncbi:MAG: hypothetical protein QG650_436 [Patescibacteria group bacterium]|nr:hypothetical protein [Patescibacteria group bacterium]